jgi:peptide deformylase
MALLSILRYPDPRLFKKASKVDTVDDEVRRLVADMAETMYAAPGIGLAATQVDVHRQVIVIDVSEDKSQLLTLINPEILQRAETECMSEEGCLSVPGIYEVVRRSHQIRARALNANGEVFEIEAEGMLAVCVQHEIDHLQGKVFVDYLSLLKRARIRHKLSKLAKASA